MRFEQSRHPEFVEGLLAMGKLQGDGYLVRGVQRPSATVQAESSSCDTRFTAAG